MPLSTIISAVGYSSKSHGNRSTKPSLNIAQFVMMNGTNSSQLCVSKLISATFVVRQSYSPHCWRHGHVIQVNITCCIRHDILVTDSTRSTIHASWCHGVMPLRTSLSSESKNVHSLQTRKTC